MPFIWRLLLGFIISVLAPLTAAAIIGGWHAAKQIADDINDLRSAVELVQAKEELRYTEPEARKEHAEIWRTDRDQYNKLRQLQERIQRLEISNR